jgi:hypothetical protein
MDDAHAVALDLEAIRRSISQLRRPGATDVGGRPFALHGAALTDLAPGHSLMGAARWHRLYLFECKSATRAPLPGIIYLADQRGHRPYRRTGQSYRPVPGRLAICSWRHAFRQVARLVIAGAPVDLDAAPSAWSGNRAATPEGFAELIA